MQFKRLGITGLFNAVDSDSTAAKGVSDMEIRAVSGKDKTKTSSESEEAANRLEPKYILDQTMLGRKRELSLRTSAALSLKSLWFNQIYAQGQHCNWNTTGAK